MAADFWHGGVRAYFEVDNMRGARAGTEGARASWPGRAASRRRAMRGRARILAGKLAFQPARSRRHYARSLPEDILRDIGGQRDQPRPASARLRTDFPDAIIAYEEEAHVEGDIAIAMKRRAGR